MNISSPLERYRIFVVVAETGSLTRAAERLYLSQPAISQAMKKLEDEVGSPLLLRGSRGVRVTPEGAVLLDHLQQAFQLIDTGERHVAAMQRLNRGEVRIGASDNLCRHYLLPVLSDFHRNHPEVRLHVTNRTSLETVELLHAGQIEFGVVNLPIMDPRLVVHSGPALHDCFVVGERYRHLARAMMPLSELAKQPVMVLDKGSVTRSRIETFLEENGVSLRPEIELGSIDLLAAFAHAGFGVAAVVREFVEKELIEQQLFQLHLEPEMPIHHVGLVRLPDVPLSRAAEALFNNLQDVRFPT
ncbi:LysR family transcriptional regulator [Sulfobacillus harzensis]|uniref:LysR family transcriptional regulator n=1 Tax=Sulfobacillus harzensis TaxID=2729629 RepID=A0A7Y0L401_9FIRM|nr:LysR family transcriptional regulator [Sulfobacillus harzensis]NMP21489.1 LysR family transcriptional regulator [Sulfobacillus harzensis]